MKGDSFVADKPRLWSETKLADLGGQRNVGIAPDGKRFVAFMPAEGPEAQQAQIQIVFLENFADELRRKVPTGKQLQLRVACCISDKVLFWNGLAG